jgi:hypothetical protein
LDFREGNDPGHYQFFGDFDAVECDVKQFDTTQSGKALARGFRITRSAFRKDWFRGEKSKLAALSQNW